MQIQLPTYVTQLHADRSLGEDLVHAVVGFARSPAKMRALFAASLTAHARRGLVDQMDLTSVLSTVGDAVVRWGAVSALPAPSPRCPGHPLSAPHRATPTLH